MAKSERQKLKILYLLRLFIEKTDESHSLGMQDIITALEKEGISAERKSVYSDIRNLNDFGFNIVGCKTGNGYQYSMEKPLFELAELKLLVDSVQAAKFITEKKSRDLIRRLEKLCSTHEAKQLDRQLYVAGRIKSMNDTVMYAVDTIHGAISHGKKICFRYWNWDTEKRMKLRRNGEIYKVSPWALSWDEEKYYLIAFDDRERICKHYRVDKMLNIEMTGEDREGAEVFRQLDMGAYSTRTFGMFGGKEHVVILECENSLAGVIIDRFGKNISLQKKDADHFVTRVPVAVSGPFLGWIAGLGGGVRIVGPQEVKEMMAAEVKRLSELYLKGDEKGL